MSSHDTDGGTWRHVGSERGRDAKWYKLVALPDESASLDDERPTTIVDDEEWIRASGPRLRLGFAEVRDEESPVGADVDPTDLDTVEATVDRADSLVGWEVATAGEPHGRSDVAGAVTTEPDAGITATCTVRADGRVGNLHFSALDRIRTAAGDADDYDVVVADRSVDDEDVISVVPRPLDTDPSASRHSVEMEAAMVGDVSDGSFEPEFIVAPAREVVGDVDVPVLDARGIDEGVDDLVDAAAAGNYPFDQLVADLRGIAERAERTAARQDRVDGRDDAADGRGVGGVDP